MPPEPPIPAPLLDDDALELAVPPMPSAPPMPPAPPLPPVLPDELLDVSPDELLDELELLPVNPVPPDELPSSVPVAHAPRETRRRSEERSEACMKSLYAFQFVPVKRDKGACLHAIFRLGFTTLAAHFVLRCGKDERVFQVINSPVNRWCTLSESIDRFTFGMVRRAHSEICLWNVTEIFTTTQDLGHDLDLARPKPQPFLFVVLHSDEPARGGARCALVGADVVMIGRGARREITRGATGELQLRLPSSSVSKEHARIERRGDTWSLRDLGSRNGSCINGQKVTNAVLRDGDWIEIGAVMLRYRAGISAMSECSDDTDLVPDGHEIRGHVSLLPDIEASFRALLRVAQTPITTLITGETGTGKEVVARGLHGLSGRQGPFVAVNCAALTSVSLESLLFGHVKGAFAGAIQDEPGIIRAADGGTLFLDEVGDLPLPAQAVLLRVLQEREVVPVGGTHPAHVDVRIVAATNKVLETLCVQGKFRADLLARLSGYQHVLRPLRDRMEDLGILIGDLLRRSSLPDAHRMRVHLQVARKLVTYAWPMNIRELDHVLSVAVTLKERDVIEFVQLPETHAQALSEPSSEEDLVSNPEALREKIVHLLEQNRGNVTFVARALGKSRMQLHRWMQKFGIDPETYRVGS